MKYLVGIPVVTGYNHTIEAVESVLKSDQSELLIIDNNAEPKLKEYFESISDNPRVHIIVNEKNIYVNPAWNQIMKFFLDGDYDNVIILNSDAILCNDWDKFLDGYYDTLGGAIPVPRYVKNKTRINPANIYEWGFVSWYFWKDDLEEGEKNEYPSIPGVCICLTREDVELIYPIPDTIRVWMGDDYIYKVLMRKHDRSISIIDNFECYHAISQTVSRVPEISEIIEQDKLAWEKIKQQYGL